MALVFASIAPVPVMADYVFNDGFEITWTGEYYSPWTVEGYRHGDEPVAIMKQTTTAHSGSYGLQLEMKSVPQTWMWWGAINANVPEYAMQKQYDPYMSVWYYDEYTASDGWKKGGQLYAVPSLVTGDDDWTDVQFGARAVEGISQNYYYTWADSPHPAWQDTGVARDNDWHHLKFQLSSADGHIRFYLDGNLVGTSTRNDYTDLGSAILMVMFDDPLSAWGDNKPYAIFDDYQVGSSVPIPTAVLLMGAFLGRMAAYTRRRRNMLS
ncbi:MAG: hypothetical protein PHW74_09130 [Desulfobacca sp.]|nr:hypothetical protein [Desulfobacca sp.]